MKKFLKSSAILSVFFSSYPVSAEDWHTFSLDTVENTISVIEMSTSSPSSTWIAYVSFEKPADIKEKDGNFPVSYVNLSLDCSRRKITLLDVINYRENMSVASQFSPNRAASIPPGSVGSSIWTIVCDIKSLPKDAIFERSAKDPHEMRREFRKAYE